MEKKKSVGSLSFEVVEGDVEVFWGYLDSETKRNAELVESNKLSEIHSMIFEKKEDVNLIKSSIFEVLPKCKDGSLNMRYKINKIYTKTFL